MRKLIAILLAMALLMGLAACGGNGDPQSSSAPESSETSESVFESSEPDAPESSEPDAPESSEPDAPESSEPEEDDKATTTEGEDEPTTTEDEADDKETSSTKKSSTSRTKKSTTNGKKITSRTIKVTTKKDEPTTTEKTTTTTEEESTPPTTAAPIDQMKFDVNGSSDDLTTWVYRLGLNGITVREAVFDSGKGGDPAEIVQISDIHFNKLNDKDFEENNPSVMANYADRTMNPNGSSRANAERCLEYAADYDQTIITGDTIDYLTWGAIEMVHDVIWKADPNAWVALGNHDMVRIWSGVKGYVKDESTLESRYKMLQDNWKHDIYYTSKVIKNKAMVVQMDNGNCEFWHHQVEKLEKDIEKARKNGYVMLLFYHIPIPTGDEKGLVYSITGNDPEYFGRTSMKEGYSANEKMYELIRNNADVIKGTFCGHLHNDYYTEIVAKTADGKDTVIPQYVLNGTYANKGHVMKITVK